MVGVRARTRHVGPFKGVVVLPEIAAVNARSRISPSKISRSLNQPRLLLHLLLLDTSPPHLRFTSSCFENDAILNMASSPRR